MSYHALAKCNPVINHAVQHQTAEYGKGTHGIIYDGSLRRIWGQVVQRQYI